MSVCLCRLVYSCRVDESHWLCSLAVTVQLLRSPPQTTKPLRSFPAVARQLASQQSCLRRLYGSLKCSAFYHQAAFCQAHSLLLLHACLPAPPRGSHSLPSTRIVYQIPQLCQEGTSDTGSTS
jgi:hypothetical protein